MLIGIAVLVGIPVFLAGLLTAILAFALRPRRGRATPHLVYVFSGSLIPALMIGYGEYLVWPWPFPVPLLDPDYATDGFPPGPLLLQSAMPAWWLCLLISRWILGRDRRTI